MFKFFFVCTLLLVFQSLKAQDLTIILRKSLQYEAFFIEPNGDTLTKENIQFMFQEGIWKFDKSQRELEITYKTDTAKISSFNQPFEKRRKKYAKNQKKRDQGKKGWENWTWLEKNEVTGFVMNDSVFSLHPPRGNQYLYNQLAGMPEVALDRLSIGGQWSSKLYIMMGWADFKGTLESNYEVKSKTAYHNKAISVSEAWLIEAKHSHSSLGQGFSKLVFDEKQYGFLVFDNTFYDGRRIVMNLVEVNDSYPN